MKYASIAAIAWNTGKAVAITIAFRDDLEVAGLIIAADALTSPTLLVPITYIVGSTYGKVLKLLGKKGLVYT